MQGGRRKRTIWRVEAVPAGSPQEAADVAERAAAMVAGWVRRDQAMSRGTAGCGEAEPGMEPGAGPGMEPGAKPGPEPASEAGL